MPAMGQWTNQLKRFFRFEIGLFQVLVPSPSLFIPFCLLLDEYESIIENPPKEVWQFVDAVSLAEGLASPVLGDLRLRQHMKDMVLEAS